MSTVPWLGIGVISLAFSCTLLMPMEGLRGNSSVQGQEDDFILPASPFDWKLAQLADQGTLSSDDVAELVARYDYVGRLRMRELGRRIDRCTLIERRAMFKRKHAALRWVLNEVRRWSSPMIDYYAAKRLSELVLWRSFFRYQEQSVANMPLEKRKEHIQKFFDRGLVYIFSYDSNLPTIQAFVDAGFSAEDVGKKCLHNAVYFSARECVQWLLRCGHDYNLGTEDFLRVAIRNNDADIVENLLKAGANPNRKDSLGSPISLACEQANRRIVELLVAYGADQNNGGLTPLDVVQSELWRAHDAKDQGRVAMLQDVQSFLTDEGPRYQQQLEADRAQLFGALQSHDFDHIEAHYHRLNGRRIKNDKGDTLLIAAARSGDPDAVSWLLSNDVDCVGECCGWEAYRVATNDTVKSLLSKYYWKEEDRDFF